MYNLIVAAKYDAEQYRVSHKKEWVFIRYYLTVLSSYVSHVLPHITSSRWYCCLCLHNVSSREIYLAILVISTTGDWEHSLLLPTTTHSHKSRHISLESLENLLIYGIEGFHVTSYQAKFESHHTCDRHVGFLFAWSSIGKHNKMSCSILFSLRHNTKIQLSKKNIRTHIWLKL